MSASAAALPAASPLGADRIVRVRVAGFVRRAAAGALDLALIAGLASLVMVVCAFALKVPLPRPRELGPDLLVAGILDKNPMAVGALGLFLGLSALYELYFGGLLGQTLGKRLLGLRIISVRGEVPGAGRGLLRVLALLPSLGLAGLGWLWCLFDREHRALHDHLAGTYVIVDV